MAGKGIERVGDTGLELKLEFPDTEMRDDFESALRVWVKDYKRAVGSERLLRALAARAAEGQGDDVAGFLFGKLTPLDPRKLNYIDFNQFV